MSRFTRLGKGFTCEVHLLVEARRLMLSADYGYCSRKARWWYESVALCDAHKRALERVLEGAFEWSPKPQWFVKDDDETPAP